MSSSLSLWDNFLSPIECVGMHKWSFQWYNKRNTASGKTINQDILPHTEITWNYTNQQPSMYYLFYSCFCCFPSTFVIYLWFNHHKKVSALFVLCYDHYLYLFHIPHMFRYISLKSRPHLMIYNSS